MKKLLLLAAITATIIAADAPSKVREITASVNSKQDFASDSIRITGSEFFLNGEITLNAEIRNSQGTIINRRSVDITTAQAATWYAAGSKEADLQALVLTAVSLTKK